MTFTHRDDLGSIQTSLKLHQTKTKTRFSQKLHSWSDIGFDFDFDTGITFAARELPLTPILTTVYGILTSVYGTKTKSVVQFDRKLYGLGVMVS